MTLKQNRLSMALDWALAKLAQPAISQPPDQEHISKSGRQRAKAQLRKSWAQYWGSLGVRKVARSEEESQRRMAAAQAKRQRRWARNLRLVAAA